MAIQFNCPYCTASIRVPDTAGGKQGTCPKCSTKLIVPKVGPAAENPKSFPNPKPSAEQPKQASDAVLPTSASQDEISEIPNIQTDGPKLGTEPSMARAVRKRAKRKGPNPFVPISLFSVVLAAIVFWMWKPAVTLDGELTAERLEEYQIPAGRVAHSDFQLPSDEVAATLEELKSSPPSGVLVRDWFDLEFRPDEKGLEVLIKKTSATEVYRVNTSNSPALRELMRTHSDELLVRRREEYQKAAQRFIEEWKTAHDNDQPLDMTAYRNSLGFNRLTGIRGFALVAQVGSRSFRAVHEDSNGDLYFLLPKSTDEFVLRGRTFADGTLLIPGQLTVKVNESKPEQPAEPTPESPMDTSEPNSEPTNSGEILENG